MKQIIVGADIGGTRTKLGILEKDCRTIIDTSIAPTSGKDAAEFLNNFINQISELLWKHDLDFTNVVGLGVSIGSYIFNDAGIVDTMGGFINIPDLYPLKDALESRLSIPCKVENDARLICLAESLFGAGDAYSRVLTITLGTGIGVGFTIDRHFTDIDACNHMSGHVKVRSRGELPELEKFPCYCAVDGCFESTCSGTALQRLAENRLKKKIRNEELFRSPKGSNSSYDDIIQTYVQYLCIGLNQLVYCYAPEVIILSGGVATGLEPYLSEIRERITASIHSKYHCNIVLSQLKESAGILGAAGLFK